MLVSSSIPNTIGGVSQQPDALRLVTSCKEQVNAWLSIVSGNQKRPATEHIAKPSLSLSGGVAGYIIERDATYRYMVCVTNGDLKVISLADGSSQTVTYPNGKTYLNASTPVDSFRFVTLGDYTFIVNRNVTVLDFDVAEPVGGVTRLNPATRGTIYVTQAISNTYYSIYINGSLKTSYLTPVGVDAGTAVPSTAVIAANLAGGLAGAGYTVTTVGSTIVISNLGATDRIHVNANSGDKSMKCFRDTVQSFSDLPPQAPEGLIVKVQGDPKDNNGAYYVTFRANVWKETIAYNSGKSLDESTMPHVLIRNGDGTWTFKRHTWVDKAAGDLTSNAQPSFIGRQIRDIFVFQNRMGFLSDENIILSETDKNENFYRTTCAQVLDSDRIDVAVLTSGVQLLQHAVPYNRDLLVSSGTSQFRVTYQNLLSAKTIQVKFTTAFNVSSRVKPINMGNSIYMIDDRADYNYCKVWEYFPKDLQVSDDAEDVTSQVPEYIPYNAGFFAGSNRVKVAVLSSLQDPANLYVYKFFWSGEQKIQTAWHKWTFTDCVKVHWGGFAGIYFYMLVERSDGISLERMRFDEDVFSTNKDYNILLDRRSTPLSTSYDSVTDTTTITTRWGTTAVPEVVSTEPGDPSTAVNGYRHVVTKVSSTVCTVSGDITSHTITCGLPYTWYHKFSRFYHRQSKGNGGSAPVILDGRLQLRYLTIQYNDTAYLSAFVKHLGRDVYQIDLSSNVVGSGAWQLGVQSFSSGKLSIPVMSVNTDVEIWLQNDTPFPSAIGGCEWQGQIAPKSANRV